MSSDTPDRPETARAMTAVLAAQVVPALLFAVAAGVALACWDIYRQKTAAGKL